MAAVWGFAVVRNVRLREATNHEDVTSKTLTSSSIKEKLVGIDVQALPQVVADMIDKNDKKCIFTSIVSGQLNADRLDCVAKNPYVAGVSPGGIGLNWLMRNFQAGEDETGKFLFVDSKAYISMKPFTVTLFQLYPTNYLHKKLACWNSYSLNCCEGMRSNLRRCARNER